MISRTQIANHTHLQNKWPKIRKEKGQIRRGGPRRIRPYRVIYARGAQVAPNLVIPCSSGQMDAYDVGADLRVCPIDYST